MESRGENLLRTRSCRHRCCLGCRHPPPGSTREWQTPGGHAGRAGTSVAVVRSSGQPRRGPPRKIWYRPPYFRVGKRGQRGTHSCDDRSRKIARYLPDEEEIMSKRPFKILGIQQIAVGGLDKDKLRT